MPGGEVFAHSVEAKMLVLSRMSCRARKLAVSLGLLCSLVAAGCSKVQMGYNVLSFDTAIADTANQQLLLNAVRSSQHYPKSFTQPGELKAAPPVSGGLDSTFNLARIGGLNTYSFTPSLAVDGGYTEFQLKNLNFEDYMLKIRGPINGKITGTFTRNPNWPQQLRELLYVQSFVLSEQDIGFIDSKRKAICAQPSTVSQRRRCEILTKQIGDFRDRCTDLLAHFDDVASRIGQFRQDRGMYYNTAANYCHYNRFRIFLEEVELTKPKICPKAYQIGCVFPVQRTALDMIGYLGELIAAQNYISEPFMPDVAVGISVGSELKFEDVPVFEVRIGPPGGPASVLVMHEGLLYYIPRPDFGSPLEARSMQTLDLVLQTVQAATTKDDVPKTSPTVSVVPSKKG
jgi:hypothetical protein